MFGIWQYLISLLVALLLLQYLKQLWLSRKFPPGPLQLPLIGGLWRIGFNFPTDIFVQLAKQYGNIYTVWMGHHPIIVLSGYQTVKEGMMDTSESFSNRPRVGFIDLLFKQIAGGIIFGSGYSWKEHRRFALNTMRKIGIGKKSMESSIKQEIQLLVETFQQTEGQPFNPYIPISYSVCNVICAVSIGDRFSVADENFKKKMKNLNFIGKYGMSMTAFVYEMIPWLMNYLPGYHKKALHYSKSLAAFLKKEVQKHKDNRIHEEPQDIIDFYLLQMEKRKQDPVLIFNEDNLVNCMMDFLIAGTETTATSLQWALLLMVCYPDVQDKVYKEMEDAFGSFSVISYEDHKNLPYTNAVIHEIMRIRYILIVGIPRECSKDMVFHGFHIPKGTMIIPDLQSVLVDPSQWETPHKFNPSHFLDKDGKFVAREEFLPFGAGSRICLGENLAKMEIFLVFTHLLRAFEFKAPDGVVENIRQDPVLGFVLHPQPYKICAIPRNNS